MDTAPVDQTSLLFPRKETSRQSGGPAGDAMSGMQGSPAFRETICLDPWEAPVPPTWRDFSHSGKVGQMHALCMGLWQELYIRELVRKMGSEARDNSPPNPQVESSSQDLTDSRGLLTSPTSGCLKQTILLFL